jgi:DNA gyrase subunit A
MLKTAYLNYAVETIKDRALPDARDGLKPVHRRILYTMHEMSLSSTAKYRKSARVVGDTMGKYHPHGDAAIYDAMVRMAQDFTMRVPLVDGQGNFGSIDGDSAAAMRYTEARMSALAEELLADIKANTVEWQDNFDNTLQEPVYLPAKFPNLLVNGSEGIAVGMASKIPPHNLGEICDAVVYMAENWKKRQKITVDNLLKLIPGPDFPTGGIIYRNRQDNGSTTDVIKQAYETGQGKIIMQGIISGEDYAGYPVSNLEDARRLIVTQIPYGLNKSTLLTQIADGVRAEKIKGISDLRDESDYEGMRIVVTVMRGYQAPKVLEQLLSKTNLKSTYGVIMLALVDGEPEYLSLPRFLTLFIKHRLKVIIRRTRHELNNRQARLHIVGGLLKALASIDAVIDTIRRSRTTETARNNLMKNFKLSEKQAAAILDMQLRRLAALERKKLETERKELTQRIKYLKGLLTSEARRLAVVIEEIQEIKAQYATPRKTIILELEGQNGLVTKADLLRPEGPQIIAATTRGNLYRVPAKGFSGRQTKGATKRAVDAPLFYLKTAAEDMVLLISNKGRAWYGPIFRIPDKTDDVEMGLKKGEFIIRANIVKADGFLTMAATNGKVKRTALADLPGSEGNWNTIMGGLSSTDQIVAAGITTGNGQVMLFTKNGKAIKFAESDVNPQASSTATGVAAIKVAKGDLIISGVIISGQEKDYSVLLVSERGWAKCIPLTEFPTQGRGGQGVQTLKITAVSGKVAGATVAPNKGAANVMSGKGRRYHLSVRDFPKSNRVNRGRQIIDFGPDDTIEQMIAFE